MAGAILKKYVPKKRRGRPKGSKNKPKQTVKLTHRVFRNKVLAIVNKGRELKKLWSNVSPSNNLVTIPNGEKILLFRPTATVTDTTLPAYPPIQSLGDTAENYFRQGNQVQPVMFRFKGYCNIDTQNIDDRRTWALPSMVRLVAGFRNRNTPLVMNNNKLQLQGGTTVDVDSSTAPPSYEAVLNSFNWAEFKPFYDRTFIISPMQADDANWTPTQFKPYFNFDIKYQFPKNAKNLISREDESGANDALFDNRNIYVMMICRQMGNQGSQDYYDLTINGTSYFSFYDS